MSEHILLLGMVYSQEMTPKRGQEYRDRVRCEALENLGFIVHTVDDKHVDHPRHCNANFNNDRAFIKQIKDKWGHDLQYSHIILDYFFSPVGWARERWKPKFFAATIPQIGTKLLSPGGKIWLPNLQSVGEAISLNRLRIETQFTVHEIPEPLLHPLYVATENATEKLLLCPDNICNETQIPPLLVHSSHPFLALELTPSAVAVVDDYFDECSNDLPAGYTETLLMWDAISIPPEICGGEVFLVRVFSGGKASIQSGPFHTAMKKIQRSLRSNIEGNRLLIVEEMDTARLCELKLQPKQFVDWFLRANAYFLLAHVHQSLFNHNLVWDMKEAVAQFQRLRYHNGFPSGDQLRCPVFTQDKISYIRYLGDLAIKTMTVPLSADGTYTRDFLAEVER